jgi:hypothetical protein
MKKKSIPEGVKWSMKWAKNIVECEKLHYA